MNSPHLQAMKIAWLLLFCFTALAAPAAAHQEADQASRFLLPTAIGRTALRCRYYSYCMGAGEIATGRMTGLNLHRQYRKNFKGHAFESRKIR